MRKSEKSDLKYHDMLRFHVLFLKEAVLYGWIT